MKRKKQVEKKPEERVTSDGLRDLLLRNGIQPTMNSRKDIELAKNIMPKSKLV